MRVRTSFLIALSALAVAACKPAAETPGESGASASSAFSVAHSVVTFDLAEMSSAASASPAASAMPASVPAVSAPASAAPTVTTIGTYASYNERILADGQTKVLFFHAPWCPICRAEDAKLTTRYAQGDSKLFTTYKVDYDSEKALKVKYGVTYQHTFVKVDGQGNLIEKKQLPSEAELTALLTK